MSTYNCLSGNGGGAFGMIPLYQADYLHSKMGGAFFRDFDFMAGTSTWALATALFATGHTPKEAIDIYEKSLPDIFKSGFLRQIRGLSKYDNKNLIGIANEILGNVKLGDLKQNILIPTINSSKRETKIFKSHDPEDFDFKLVDVIIASSSAPTFFPAYQINGEWYKDGGLSSNNPSDILLKECQSKNADKINIISFTTGSNYDIVTNSEKKGSILSVSEMIDEVLEQQDKKTHGNVKFEYKMERTNGIYIRCESLRTGCSKNIDDASYKNIEAMKQAGKLSVVKNRGLIDVFYINTLKNE